MRWLQNYFVTKFRYFELRQACLLVGRESQQNDLSHNRITVKIILCQLDEVSAQNSKLR